MTTVLAVIGAIAALILCWVLYQGFITYIRKRKVARAGKKFGFLPPAKSFEPRIPCVPLLETLGEYKAILRGHVGEYPVSLFDYKFRDENQNISQTVAKFYKPDANLPLFELCPRKSLDGRAQEFSHNLVFLKFSPQFSARYILKSPEAVRALELFSPESVDRLVALPESNLEAQGCRDSISVFCPKRVVAAEDLHEFVEQAGAIASIILAHVPVWSEEEIV